MKHILAITLFAFAYNVYGADGQDLLQSQVPPAVVHTFQQEFPKAHDVEWEMDGASYKVEFDTGWFGTDHEAWYDSNGKQTRHKEDISKGDLPQSVLNKITTDYNGYGVDDVHKITEGTETTYTLELKSSTNEWKVAFGSDGSVKSKVAD